MLCLLVKTMCGGTQLTMPCADPEEGTGAGPQSPGISQILKVYIEICNWIPSPWEKLDPLDMLDRPSPWNMGKL